MLQLADKKTLFQDRYQGLILPVATSGIHRHRLLLKAQTLFPDHHSNYQEACRSAQFHTGDIMLFQPQRDLVGIGVGGSLFKPKYIVDMAVTNYAEYAPKLSYIEDTLRKLQPLLLNWGRYQGIRRVALLAVDELFLPDNSDFSSDILPLLEEYLTPVHALTVHIYR